MLDVSLFLATVLIWGTTWIGIAVQVESAPVLVAVFHRFLLAAALMLPGLALMGRLQRPKAWRFVLVQALCLFSLNFVCLYNAALLIPSGLVSVIFALASVFNAVNARIFFGDRINPRTLLAAALGVTGLVLLFWDRLVVSFDAPSLQGIGWAALGTMCFSLGNMASRRNGQLGVTPVTANAWGMPMGAALLAGLILIQGQGFALPRQPDYWLATAYLAAIGSVAGFTCYLLLVSRQGSARAGYATVVFPVVALTLSSLYEGYVWTPPAVAGLAITGLGNLVMFAPRRPRHAPA
ncbi:EamA family transporter [Paracoccus limosus]|uniref:EamA family transporter n=1 Tax=Paracoccus limosus TaxID=913252 RepID=A0A844H5M0_9RHOB|nr:EamA family transporter [Paracoccus limosus]MTH36176.1 EamA family transporter [Paracoccus limosus]